MLENHKEEKKRYMTPEMDITEFDTEDVITTSGEPECEEDCIEYSSCPGNQVHSGGQGH